MTNNIVPVDKDKDNALSGPKNPVAAALEKAELEIRRQRGKKIGSLLDKAIDVLSDVLDTDDEEREPMRMQAAQLSINLYTAQTTAERADRQLDIQEKRLEVEEKRLGFNTLLLQQNTYNMNTEPPPKELVTQEDGSVVDINLLTRKRAQQMLLDAQLAASVIKPTAVIEEEDIFTGGIDEE
jgi:hypothetical protein